MSAIHDQRCIICNQHASYCVKHRTFEQWQREWPHAAVHHANGFISVPDAVHRARSEAWRLSDYVVTSVAGGSIWLMPRLKNRNGGEL